MSLWIDSHCHMADARLFSLDSSCLESWLEEAKCRGLRYFIQGGIGPEDWDRQLILAEKYKNQIGLCFGLHPYWVAEHSAQECEEALDQLAHKILSAPLIGELGLDFRPKILGSFEAGDIGAQEKAKEKQITFFELQLELAQSLRKPVVLHLVQAHEEALRILDLWGVPVAGGFVHSFNGSAQKARDFLERGLLLSIGSPLLRPDNEKLKQTVREIPMEKLLIETDSPDQPGPKYQGKLNPLSSLFDVAEEVGRIKGISWTEVLDKSRDNLKRLLGLKENSDGTYNINS